MPPDPAAPSNQPDYTITDNGDITITNYASCYYDQYGKMVLKDPGAVWTFFVLDYNGTPGDPTDDEFVEDSF